MVDCTRFHQAVSLVGSLSQSCFSLCLAQDVVAPGLPQAVLPRYLSLRLSSFIASGPSFLLSTQRPYSGFLKLLRLAQWASCLIVWTCCRRDKMQGLRRFEFSSSHQCGVLQTFSILNVLSVHCFAQFLGRTKSRLSEFEQSPAILTSTILPRTHLKAHLLLIIELDPIERRNLGQRHSVKVH